MTGTRQVISAIDRSMYRVLRRESRRQRAVLARAHELIGDSRSPSFDPTCQVVADDVRGFVKSRFSTFECDCVERYIELQSLRATAEALGVSLHQVRMTLDVIRAAIRAEFEMECVTVVSPSQNGDSHTSKTSPNQAHTGW